MTDGLTDPVCEVITSDVTLVIFDADGALIADDTLEGSDITLVMLGGSDVRL